MEFKEKQCQCGRQQEDLSGPRYCAICQTFTHMVYARNRLCQVCGSNFHTTTEHGEEAGER